MPSCTIDSQQRLFRCSHRKKIVSETRKKIQKFVSETCGNQSQEYLVSESWVHHFSYKAILKTLMPPKVQFPLPFIKT